MEVNAEIEAKANRILERYGNTTSDWIYYPPASLGGDFYGHVTRCRFENKGLLVVREKEAFEDGSGHNELRIYQKAKSRKFLFKTTDYRVVYSSDGRTAKIFERGDWEQHLNFL